MPENTKLSRPPLLHDHLDGSFALFMVLPELFRLSGKEYPFGKNEWADREAEEIKKLFLDPEVSIPDRFSNTTGVMQSEETLRLAAKAYTMIRARQGFRYCEATIAPQYHTFGGLTEKEVIKALIKGIKAGEKAAEKSGYSIEANLVAAIGREISPEEGVRLIKIFAECDRKYVVGVGLACGEPQDPPQKHIPAFDLAKKLGFPITIHAGEWVKDRAPEATDSIKKIRHNAETDRGELLQNMLSAIMDLHADRIGHAIPLAYSKDLMQIVKDRGTGIEGCPGSNLALRYIPDASYLKIRELLDQGILYSINPDDDLFLPGFDETIALCDAEYRFTKNDLWKLEMNAWATRFGCRKHHLIPLTGKTSV